MPLSSTQAQSKYFQLYANSKRLAWDPATVDLRADVAQWQRIKADHADIDAATQILQLVALFHAGEESVTTTLAPYLGAAARLGLGLDVEMFLTSQVYEEAKHFEFFARYVREVLGPDADALDRFLPGPPQQVLIDDLADVADRLRRENDPVALRTTFVEAVTHYMGIVEAMLARTGYRGVHDALTARGWLPGLQEGFRLIRRDEGRHVAFGIHCIADACAADVAMREVVQATFERHLPNVLGTVASFQYPHPLVDVALLQSYALGAYQQFMAAAGLNDDADAARALATELADAS
ncbi:MAG: ribonucleotide-diphosphate reductase subunit beta [Gemmatimonadetes bacterium]|nr:ribonucleotide-diphosphate reductase subunit beta [Gemmatimonadota bacterium]